MKTLHHLRNKRAILRATREDRKLQEEKLREARKQLHAVMLKIYNDPRLGHLSFCEVGRLYVEQERALGLIALNKGSCLTLSAEIKTLAEQLKEDQDYG